jgi:hypothetical protein
MQGLRIENAYLVEKERRDVADTTVFFVIERCCDQFQHQGPQ